MNKENKIIAHRGIFNNINIPENSIKSFKEAIKYNYPFELDIQLTKDNKLVVFHDYNTKRMTNEDYIIQESTYDEIKDLCLLNTKYKIPLFKEILKINNDKCLIDIEIKNTKRIKETIDELIKELTNYNNYIVKSFNPKIVRYIKKNYPNIKCGLLLKSKYKNKLLNIIAKTNFIIKYSKCDFIAISQKLLNSKKYKKKSSKIETLVWTISKMEDINYDNDITYICNNLPFIKKQ